MERFARWLVAVVVYLYVINLVLLTLDSDAAACLPTVFHRGVAWPIAIAGAISLCVANLSPPPRWWMALRPSWLAAIGLEIALAWR